MTDDNKMPCGSPHSCLDCRHFFMVTDPCTYLEGLTEDELDHHMDVLKERKKAEKEKEDS